MAEAVPIADIHLEILETSKEVKCFLMDLPQAVGNAVGDKLEKLFSNNIKESELINSMRG